MLKGRTRDGPAQTHPLLVHGLGQPGHHDGNRGTYPRTAYKFASVRVRLAQGWGAISRQAGQSQMIFAGAGLSGFELTSAYAAAEFGLEGWMSRCSPRFAPFGIATHHRQPPVLPHRSADPEVGDLRHAVPRALRRPVMGSGCSGTRAGTASRPATRQRALITIAEAAAPPPRRRRCHRPRRAERPRTCTSSSRPTGGRRAAWRTTTPSPPPADHKPCRLELRPVPAPGAVDHM